MISRDKLNWNKRELYLGSSKTGYSVVFFKGQDYVGKFFKIRFPDGAESEDFYNLSRAKDNAMKQCIEDMNLDLGI